MSEIRCECGILLGTDQIIRRNFPDSHLPFAIGHVTTLLPGFVATSRRDPSGAARYVRSKTRVDAPSPKIHPPAIVVCKCGRDTSIMGIPDSQRAMATEPAEHRQNRIRELMTDLDNDSHDPPENEPD